MAGRGEVTTAGRGAARPATGYVGALPPSPLVDRTILQVVPELGNGGTERSALAIVTALAEAGARAFVAAAGGPLVPELQAKGGIWLPFPTRSKNPLAMAVNATRLARIIRRERVDIVHARSRLSAWVAFGATRLGRRRFVTSFAGDPGVASLFRLRYNAVLARGDAVIVPSRFAAEAVTRLYPKAADRIAVIGSGVDLKAFAPAAVGPARVQVLRRAWNVSADERVVLLAARLLPANGQRVLVEAARLLREAGVTDCKIILAGEPSGRRAFLKELDTQIEACKVDGLVRRIGHCADMPAALLAASVVVVPALRPDAFPRVALEAQAMGTPVVASAIGAMAEAIEGGGSEPAGQRTGWLVPPDDSAALAAAIREALDLGASARDALARRARAHIERSFSAERSDRATLALYAGLLARPEIAGS